MNLKSRRVTLGDICSFKYGQMPTKQDLAASGYPIFSGYRIVGYASRYHYRDPEIVVVARGVGGTGDVKMSPPCCFLTNLSIAILITSKAVDKTFLYYRLAARGLWELRTGSAQAQITIDRLRRYEIDLPPLEVQRRIGSMVAAYDELITNNERRSQIAEEIARHLNDDYFLTRTGTVGIARGWRLKTFAELVDIQKGKKPRTASSQRESGAVPYLLLDAIRGGAQQYVSPEGMVLAEPPDVVMVADGGSSGIVTTGLEGAVGSTLSRLRTRDAARMPPARVYLLLASRETEIRSKNVGAAIPHANLEYIRRLEIAVPPAPINAEFEAACRPLLDLIRILLAQNRNLREAQGLLLAALLAREISDDGVNTQPQSGDRPASTAT